MANSVRVGSKGHQLMVMAWLAVTSGLLVLLSMFGLSAAAGSNPSLASSLTVAVPDHTTEYPSRNYAGLFWSIYEVRHTAAKTRPCFQNSQSEVCKSVVVVEVVVTNANKKSASVSVKDLSLAFPQGALHPAQRFDCSTIEAVRTLQSSIKDLRPVCPQPEDGFIVAPGESRLLSVLFIPDASFIPDLEEVGLYIQQADKQASLPAILPLAGVVAPSGYPIHGIVDLQNSAQKMMDPNSPGSQLTIEPEFLQVDTNHYDYRVKEGNRLLMAQVSIKRLEKEIPRALLQSEFWSLQVDGVVLHPERIIVETSDADHIVLRFSFAFDEGSVEEIEGTDFVLLAGDSSASEAALVFPLQFK